MNDLRFAFRQLLKNPGFTAMAVFTLALGIGATASVFSLIQGVLLTRPPYPKPEQLVLISPARLDGQPFAQGCTAAQWLEWQRDCKSFEAMAGYGWGFQFLVLSDGSESVRCMPVTPDYFKVMGIKPLLGRAFLPSDTPRAETSASVIILGYDLWQRRFNADRAILGKIVRLSRFPPLTVVGVMPPGIRFLPVPNCAAEPNYDVNAMVDYWAPAGLSIESKDRNWNVIGRLHNGSTVRQAQSELTAITARQANADHDFDGITARLQLLTAAFNSDGRRVLLPLLGAVALVFLIACENVAGLLLARGLQRQQEYAVRCALGARRVQLFRQVLTESLLLALAGGALGVVLAVVLAHRLKAIGGFAIPRLDAVTAGGPVLAFCFGSAVVSAMIAGLVPAFHTSLVNPADGLKGTRTSSAGRRDRRFLGGVAILQTALTLALLVGAGLLIRTVHNLTKMRPGYETQNILTMNVTMPDPNKFADFHSRALTRISALPGVKKVAFGWGVPLTGNNWMNQVRIEGQSDTDTGSGKDFKNEMAIPTRSVTADYFDALGLRVVSGRGFHSTDAWYGPDAVTNAAFVVMINEAFAAKYFARVNPIGRKLRFSPGIGQSAEIVGVVADARNGSLTQKPEPEVYFSLWQLGPFTKHLVIRTDSNPRLLIGALQHELRDTDPTVAVEHIKTLEQIRAESVASQTFAMRLLIGFSLVGSILALVGIYGVLSLSVGSRRREIAIRMALGAQRCDVLGLILSEGLTLIFVGLLAGTGLALALGKVLRAFLFGVEPTDLITFAGMAILFTAAALLAGFIPARRATKTDPMEALRWE